MPADWLRGALKTAEEWRTLPDDWDSYGARAVQSKSVDQAREFLKRLADEPNIPAPFAIVPDRDGQIVVEWDTVTQGLDIICHADGPLAYDYADDQLPDDDDSGRGTFQHIVSMIRKLRIEEAGDV